MIPTRKKKTYAITIPAMAPKFNNDVEKVLLFWEKGAQDDVGGKVDEDGLGDTDEASDRCR